LLDRLGTPGMGVAFACLLSAIAVCLLVGPAVVLHPGRAAVGRNPASDFQIMTWSLSWWPWAFRHGVDPLHTPLIWAPGGFSTLWMTTIPAAAFVALPLTLAAGPLVAFNVLMIAAVVLATGAAYLLCRELTGRFAPSLVGGLLFGLSPYMLGHMLSQHLNLTLVFPLPLLALAVVRYARGLIGAARFVVSCSVLLLFLLGSSLELFVDATLIAAVMFVVAVLGGGARRRDYARVGALGAAAYAACLPVVVPIAVLALSAPHAALRSAPANYVADLLNVIIPTPTILLGGLHAASSISRHFAGNIGERDAYLGLPLLAVSAAAVRTEWRRGAAITAVMLLSGLVLSLGPTITLEGRPLARSPLTMAGLPVLRDALPARMSVFAALGAACLCALWLARPGRRGLRVVVAALVAASLFPNFAADTRVPDAWAASDAFSWSTPHVPLGFATRTWTSAIRPGSNILVLPTGDRTAASYWQARTGMSVTLAMPATPFVPPQSAADPTVARLVEDNLPALAGAALGGARLRSVLLARRIAAVVVTRSAARRWSRLVRDSTGTKPVSLNNTIVYRVPQKLEPLAAIGELATAHHGRRRVAAWLRFDGRRAHLRVLLRERVGAMAHALTLSAPDGDAAATAAAIDAGGRAAVSFTEWRNHRLLLRVATYAASRWRVATLDRRKEPIWSPRVVVTPNGTTLASWIDEANPVRMLRVAVLPPGGGWVGPLTLDHADGLGSMALRSGGGNLAVIAWLDSVASQTRVRAATYNGASWSPPATLAASLGRLDHIAVGGGASSIRWRRHAGGDGRYAVFDAARRGVHWSAATVASRRSAFSP
jgi:hypothetical protein